ncbi:MAG: cupredoxin domain-containing protein [Actinomycetota bacterium]|nr:cupredoxin domain-containing protein [Actinomycetota bacterium]
MKRPVAALALLLVVATAACGGSTGGEGEGGTTSVRVTARDFEFDPASLSVEPGAKLSLELSNDGETEHSLTSDELEVDLEAEPGESAAARFTAPEGDATIEFHCRYHPDQMTGTATVGEGGDQPPGESEPGSAETDEEPDY